MPRTSELGVLAARRAAIRAAPAGSVAVVDETALLATSAVAAHAGEALRSGRTAWRALPGDVALLAGAGDDEDAVRRLVAGWAGEDEPALARRARAVLRDELGAALRPEMWSLVLEHRRAGHHVVVTGHAPRPVLAPIAEDLEADELIATEVAVGEGTLTGEVEGPVLFDGRGGRKAAALGGRAVAFAYAGPGAEALLAAAEHPLVVSATPRDGEHPVLPVAPRGGTLATPGDVLRTAGFYGALASAAGTAAAVGLARRSRRHMIDLTCSVTGDLGLALAGIDVEVTGAEHLWSARPCVFVFNHQSKIDVALLMKLLRGGFTGVAKAEAASIPLWGAMFKLAGVAFVDRGNTRQAKEALEPAVRKLRDEGWSLAIAPEGTRSPTPRLGRFKKGAFHIAMQAGVPMVPIVIHDAGEVMWRGHQTLRGGTVHVDVLPPIDTADWTVGTLTEHVEDVRSRFVAVLEGAT
ncbi:putative phosphoserine phosphatase/1-acylglycerol-3-phosphate O-acyltransferase [Actinomycetospora succinea]|uniref:1-acyl-sn-glycerol-3-phosphate acyltransferase n=1 Tax=Actinomycetospora succinea TaxID=663603 RepID=A0A4R6UQC3_9PSEU|nr:1-acylglycerol-3-phosphate O-acyltransferase [Actinomycetospora succinea]TDQ47909.1 putative phosphoserine phosphatase/1-acylglycerol-3-phosphate O-acyltransferase [Actinomycetospora succinea]